MRRPPTTDRLRRKKLRSNSRFFELLSQCVRLEVLDLADYGPWANRPSHNGEFFRKVAQAIPRDVPIRQLRLCRCDVDEPDLALLIAMKVLSIEHLELQGFTLGEGEKWHRVLALLLSYGERLQTIKFDALSCHGGDSYAREELRRGVDFRGKGGIEAGLKMLLNQTYRAQGGTGDLRFEI